mgnify:CR=1 FL=1|tara:strand:+ start:372 stop:566 length:195 start_codon:yes stop_codon:yes gene_type:complete
MTPKEKADELFKKMYGVRSVTASDITKHFAKQSALVAVNEILLGHMLNAKISFWSSVYEEIEKL